jgi:hypothetical protein
MRRTTMLWEVFVTRFEEAFGQYRRRRLNADEAGELLDVSGRHFRRLCDRYEEEGSEGLRDRRIGKVSPRRAPARELERMQELYRERYNDFTVKHFHEQLVRRHNYRLSYTVIQLTGHQVRPAFCHYSRDGKELSLASWDQAAAEDWLGKWAMNLMLINVSTRRFGRARAAVPAPSGPGVSKSAASRRFVEASKIESLDRSCALYRRPSRKLSSQSRRAAASSCAARLG